MASLVWREVIWRRVECIVEVEKCVMDGVMEGL